MTTLLITSIEDVHEYVEKHHSSVAVAWARMLYDVKMNGFTYYLSDFLNVSDQLYGDGASMADILLEENKARGPLAVPAKERFIAAMIPILEKESAMWWGYKSVERIVRWTLSQSNTSLKSEVKP